MKALKAIVVTTSLIFVLTAGTNISSENKKEQLVTDDLYACSWWPFCRDPEQQKPVSAPSDSSVPKPADDKETTKDKKEQTQLA